MIKRNVDVSKVPANERYSVNGIVKCIESDKLYGKILVLFGLRRTGKTTIMEQLIARFQSKCACAFYEVTANDDMDSIRDIIIQERDAGTSFICIDEITKAKDFITDSATLSDVFAKEGMTIVVTGTDSLGFSLAEGTELFDRALRVRTTHIPFAEHSKVLGVNDVDDYIMYGGLMRTGKSEVSVRDFDSARRYLDSSVAENIASSITKDPHNSELKKLSIQELRAIIEKMVEIYSGIFNKEQMKNQLSKVSVNVALDLLAKSENSDYIKPVLAHKRDIANDFTKVINADTHISVEITDGMVLSLENYLIDMDLLSAIPRKEYRYTDELGWRESQVEREFYIVQPAIKYFHLQKGKQFIAEEDYYQMLPLNLKLEMQQKLNEKIKGDMLERIVVFDVFKDLSKEQYFICKPDFYVNGQKCGEFDMLVYDKDSNVYWSFEIKHTMTACAEQIKHLKNERINEIVDANYGSIQYACVLYRGNSFLLESDSVIYLNVADFLRAVNEFKDMHKVMSKLTKNLSVSSFDKSHAF